MLVISPYSTNCQMQNIALIKSPIDIFLKTTTHLLYDLATAGEYYFSLLKLKYKSDTHPSHPNLPIIPQPPTPTPPAHPTTRPPRTHRYTYLHTYTHVHTHTHAHIRTHTHTHTHAQRMCTHRHTHTHTHTLTHTHSFSPSLKSPCHYFFLFSSHVPHHLMLFPVFVCLLFERHIFLP